MSLIAQQNKQKSVGFRVATLASVMLGAAVTLTACGGGEHEEVKAVDKVEEAAEMARANAPEAEVLEFEETEAPTDTEATDADATEGDAAEGEDATEMDAADDMATADTAEAAATDTAATTDAEQPADEEASAQ